MQPELEATVKTFRQWLYLEDLGPLLVILGTVAANLLDGDPVWTLLVAPPGAGKSEILSATTGLPNAHAAATLTEAALLSGTPKKELATGAKGGLLRLIGDFGIVVAKDFGSVLSMNRDARSLLLAALREVYDGSWTRHVGTDGGRTLSWSGKVGLIGGCTATIDRHHAVMGAMGERFVLYRLPTVDADTQARRALAHAGRERQMRAELSGAVTTLLGSGPPHEPRARTAAETTQLVSLATLVVRARSAVERDGHTREVELVPEPEAPTRLIVVLDRLLAGLDAIGVDRDPAWKVVTKAGLDSIPALRQAVMRELLEAGLPVETASIAEAVRHPTSTVRRTLEDLTAHAIVNRDRAIQGKSDRWSLSTFATEGLTAALTVPEMSSYTLSGEKEEELHAQTDISGKHFEPSQNGASAHSESDVDHSAREDETEISVEELYPEREQDVEDEPVVGRLDAQNVGAGT